MKKYVVELIGTFFLVCTIGCAVIQGGAGVIAPLAIGSILMTMIFAGGHISGAHYNPAVTIAVWMRGKCPTSDLPGYLIAQIAAALLAVGTVSVLKGSPPVDQIKLVVMPALIAEF